MQYGTRYAHLPSRARFRKWLQAALRTPARVTLRVVGKREARLLNRQYRGLDYATNVLTFVYSSRRPLAGDIAICAPVVAGEARVRGISREAHYAHMTVHGALHLQGYDHARSRDAERMERLEARILDHLGYADPYAGKAKRLSSSPRERHTRRQDGR